MNNYYTSVEYKYRKKDYFYLISYLRDIAFQLSFCFLLCLPFLSVGQFDDYWGIAGGNLNLNYLQDPTDTYTDAALDLRIGKFLSDELILGVGISIGTSIQQNIKKTEDRFSSTSTGLTAFGQFYFQQFKQFHFYVEPELFFSKIYRTDDAIGLGSTGDRINYFRGSLGIGGIAMINKNIAFTGLLNASILENWTTGDQTFSTSLRPEVKFGLQFFVSDYDPKKEYSKKKQPIEVLKAENWTFGANARVQNRLLSDTLLIISPSISYFSIKNLAIGLTFNGVFNLGNQTNHFEIVPFMRYHQPLGRNYIFFEGGIGWSQKKIQSNTAGTEEAFEGQTDLFGEAKIGLGLFVSKYTALHGGLRYRYIVAASESFDVSLGNTAIGLEIGMLYFFERDLSKYELPTK